MGVKLAHLLSRGVGDASCWRPLKTLLVHSQGLAWLVITILITIITIVISIQNC